MNLRRLTKGFHKSFNIKGFEIKNNKPIVLKKFKMSRGVITKVYKTDFLKIIIK